MLEVINKRRNLSMLYLSMSSQRATAKRKIALSDDRYCGCMLARVKNKQPNLWVLTYHPTGLVTSNSSKYAIICNAWWSLLNNGWFLQGSIGKILHCHLVTMPDSGNFTQNLFVLQKSWESVEQWYIKECTGRLYLLLLHTGKTVDIDVIPWYLYRLLQK